MILAIRKLHCLLFACCCLPLLAGCGASDPAPQTTTLPPRAALKLAVRNGQWERAWKYFDDVLAEHDDDPDLLASLAQVAHHNQHPDKAADLLAQACRAEAFRNESRVQQAMVALIGVGRLHDGMQLLQDAVTAHPEYDETRRWLYDFLMGTEDRLSGLEHGRELIRRRKFDLELLLSLSNTERRTQDAEVLKEMIQRNPDDLRPKLGIAKAQFDDGQYDDAIETLQAIVNKHPQYMPAAALLGRTLAAANRYDQLEQWASIQPAEIQQQSGYWLAVGDWARSKSQPAQAARAYWEATRRDPDLMEAWTKLSTMLQQIDSGSNEISNDVLAAVKRRAADLSRFNQLKHRFVRTSSISRATAMEIVQALRDLGRLWEAEAWASIATTLPPDDAVDVVGQRREIVALLSTKTPWQLTDPFPELRADFTALALPSISALRPQIARNASGTPKETRPTSHLRLINEADDRGLHFFGRTGDDLDQPGIMLHETVGCGGGTIDFDLDGWSDLYLAAAGGTPPARDSHPNALMRNLEGRFVDVTQYAGVGDTGFGQGIAVGDINQDGFADLLVANYGPNRLYLNNGDGTFSDVSDRLPDSHDQWSTSAAIGDLDGDGLPEVVIVNYCAGTDPITTPCPMKDTGVIRSCSPMMFAADPDRFIRIAPDGTMTDVTQQWHAQPDVIGRGLGIVIGAFDNARGNDVFIANDMTNNHFWSLATSTSGDPSDENAAKQRDARATGDDSIEPASSERVLVESAMLRGLAGDDRALAQGSMGIATGDLDGDADVDFYVTNFDKEYNTLHEQTSPGVWQDRTSQRGLAEPTLPWVGFGTEAVDLDSDGDLEIVVTNGHVDMFSRGDEQSIYRHPMQVFQRDGQRYLSVAESMEGDYIKTPHVGRALWTLDANRDGLADFAVTHQTEPVALLVNRTEKAGHGLAIELVGRSCQRDAVGAVVSVEFGDQAHVGYQTAGDGYLCSNERILRFATGTFQGPCRVRVSWPDGSEQTFQGLETDRCWLLVQGDAQPFARQDYDRASE